MNTPLASISEAETGALAAGNLALVIPAILGGSQKGYQPIPGINDDGTVQPKHPSFMFQYEGENKIELKSQITDHYVEVNTAIQNNIALEPIIVTVHGFVGELTDTPQGALAGVFSAAKTVADKLQGVSAYAPGLSIAAQKIYNNASQAYQTASSLYNTGKSVLDAVTGNGGVQGKQAQAYIQFKNWWQSRMLFNVQTPWDYLRNMAILDIVVRQDEKTAMITDFFVTFKQMNFASTDVTLANSVFTSSLGSSLFNSARAQISLNPPQSGSAPPSLLPGTLSAGVF